MLHWQMVILRVVSQNLGEIETEIRDHLGEINVPLK